MLVWLIISPVLLAGLMFYLKKYFESIGYLILLITLTCNFILTVFLYPRLDQVGIITEALGGWSHHNGIILALDHLGYIMLFAIQALFFMSFIFSKEYMKHDLSNYLSLFFLLQAGLTGIVLTSDIFNMYVALEIISIVSYALVAYQRDKWGLEAGFKYLVIGSIGSLIFLWGIALIYATTGHLNLALLSESFGSVQPMMQLGIFVLLFVGLGIKSAVFPFHAWLPDAHSSAPAPISAVLSGIVIKIPLYCLLRIYSLLYTKEFFLETNFHLVVAGLGTATVVVGHLMAYRQNQFKRLLSYSSMAQIGYILIGMSTLSLAGLQGAIFHIISHGILKSGLFFIAGYLILEYDVKNIRDLKGLYSKNPRVSLCFLVLALGMIGLPPSIGFISKWMITMAAMEAGLVLPALGVIVGGLLALLYYLRIFILIFQSEGFELQLRPFIDEFMLRIPIFVMTTLSISLVPMSNSIHRVIIKATQLLLETGQYVNTILGGG